jgi:CTP-dependent riboflavin kinase
MTDDEMNRVIAALDTGRSVSFYGADGEWGYRGLGGGRYVYVSRVPYEPGVEEVVGADEVRKALGTYAYEHVAARLR